MRIAHVVMGGGIVVGAYWDPTLAMRHARCVTGCDVTPLDMESIPAVLRALVEVEIRHELPPDIIRDLEVAEFDDSGDTPEVVDVDEIDDAER